MLLVNVAVVDGPLSAYRWLSRKLHRIFDWIYVFALVAGVIVLDLDQSTRTTLSGVAIVIIVMAITTDYTKRVFRRS